MFEAVFRQLRDGVDLSLDQAYQVGKKIFNNASETDIETLLCLLSQKGETVDELLGMIKAIKQNAIKLNIDTPIVDIVGTGGDSAGTINISTAAALLTSALKVPVIKHGNRAVSSKCGSADILEALGYSLQAAPEKIIIQVKQDNFAFCFAQEYYPMFAKVKNIRKKLKVPTIFNLIGPLLNPSGTEYMVLGVYTQEKVELLAKTILAPGLSHMKN